MSSDLVKVKKVYPFSTIQNVIWYFFPTIHTFQGKYKNITSSFIKIGLQIELTQTQTIIASKGPITVYCCNNRTPILPLPYLHNEIRGLQTDSFLNLYYIYLLKATSCDSNLTYSDWRPHVSCLHLSSGVLNQFLNRSSGEDMFSCF